VRCGTVRAPASIKWEKAMEPNSGIRLELRQIFRARVGQSFAKARDCLGYARAARIQGASEEVAKWMRCVRVMRHSAALWRQRAQRIAPVLACFLWCLAGCGKTPTRDISCDFDVQPGPGGRDVLWTLKFSREEYHVLVDSVPENVDINSQVHSKVRELIAAGLRINGLVGCRAEAGNVAKLVDGSFVFLGSCDVSAHSAVAGGI
jgi:hypothetical protein